MPFGPHWSRDKRQPFAANASEAHWRLLPEKFFSISVSSDVEPFPWILRSGVTYWIFVHAVAEFFSFCVCVFSASGITGAVVPVYFIVIQDGGFRRCSGPERQ